MNERVEIVKYVLHHAHRPAQCEEISEACEAPDAAPALRGLEFYCYCRSGDHGGFIVVGAESPEAAIALPPALLRPTIRVYAAETLGSEGPLPPRG